ncbi:uncharacterized protein LOC124818241 [Hydra vulgaris]|uniref:uncharacterized protein LOC124818241 n=1 Tax=Hydra vulgaris TaxID=6087 RepID=UPI001F5E9F86|nr:MFS-type transporter clz9-like [Hydra vulgaris]
MNAIGTFAPPIFIFPRKRIKNELMDSAPLDKGQVTHKSLAVLKYAKENSVVIFCFPAHCTHRVQPLDVVFFGPLQTYYDQEIQTWLRKHPDRVMTHFQVPGLLNNAYLKIATLAKAVHAFAKTGIYPFNPNIFEDWMFVPSLTT